jgi:hypothetical protein
MGEEWTVMIHSSNILNSNDRKHFQVTKKIKQTLRALGAAKSRELPRYPRMRMDVEVCYPPESTPDHANLVPTMKSYIDGMVSPNGKREKAAGILQDDSDKFLLGPFLTPSFWRSGRPGWYLFRIRIVELEPWALPPKPEYLEGVGTPTPQT